MEFYVVYKNDYQYSEVFDSMERAKEYLEYVQIMEPKSNLHIESVLEEEELTETESKAIDAKRFADMILEYDSKEEELNIKLLCWKWAKESSSHMETFRKVYQLAKEFWNEEELNQKILTETFTDKEFCKEIIR